MTKSSDDDTPRAKSKSKEVAVWLLMGLLVLGLGGFGVTSFGGRITTVGQVGDVEITTDDYARGVQGQVAAIAQQYGIQVSAQMLLAEGMGQSVLSDLIATAALKHEAGRIGLSVGDEVVAAEVIKMPDFQGVTGAFDRDTYAFQLDRMNQSEAEFEEGVRRDVSVRLMQAMISGGITAPADMSERLYLWANEKRGFSVLTLGEADLVVPVPAPADADLQAFYDAHPEMFVKPEARRITYAALLPQDIAADQPVDEAEVKKLYDDRIEDYVRPERRIVERLVFPDQAAADAARAKLDAGASFEELVADRGLTLSDTELGDVALEDLGEAGEAVFAASEGTVVGPLASNLGPAMFRVATVLAAEETSFEEARADLALELQLDAARAAIDPQFEAADDLLAGGATLADLAADLGMKIETIDYVPGNPGPAVIEGYAAFRDAADAVAEGDFPEVIPLEDGGLFALQLEEILPEAPIPFAEAKAAVTTAWRADALAKALSARAAEIAAEVQGGKPLGGFGIVSVTASADRAGTVEGAPLSLIETAFTMAEGEAKVIEAPGYTAVVRLDRILPAATEGDEAKALRADLSAAFAQAISTDALALFTTATGEAAGITLDQAAVEAVNQSLP